MDTLSATGKRLLNLFMNNELLNYEYLAKELDVSKKTVFNEIEKLDQVLSKSGVRITRKQGHGMWLEGQKDSPEILKLLNQNTHLDFSNSETRMYYLIVRLLEHRDYLTMDQLAEEIFVSHTTLVSDIKKVEEWFEAEDIELERRRAKGIRITTDEKKKRQVLASIYRNLKTDRSMLGMIREIRLGGNHQDLDYYVGSAVFNRFEAFDIDTLKIIVQNLEEETSIHFTDEGFAAIVIHIAIALRRAMDGNWIKLSDETVSKLKRHEEYDMAKRFLKKIESYFNVKMPDDEACYILMHMLGAKVMDSPQASGQRFTEDVLDTVKTIIRKSENLLDVNLLQDELLIRSLALHIQASMNRLENNLPIKNPYLDDIKTEYPIVFEAAIDGYDTIKSKYGFPYNDHEIAYIAIHIQAAIERQNSMTDINKVRVMIVCSSGVGTAQLVTSKFQRIFKDVDIVATASMLDIDTMDLSDVDLIVSTVPLEKQKIATVHVSPFLTSKDIKKINRALNLETNTKAPKRYFEGFTHLVDQRFIKVHSRHTDYKRLLKSMCDQLVEEGVVTPKYYESALKRENISSTAMLNVAIPHGDYTEVLKDKMMVWTLNKPIKWEDSTVETVFLLAIRKETTKQLKKFYDALYTVIGNEDLKKQITQIKDKETLYNLLSKGDIQQ